MAKAKRKKKHPAVVPAETLDDAIVKLEAETDVLEAQEAKKAIQATQESPKQGVKINLEVAVPKTEKIEQSEPVDWIYYEFINGSRYRVAAEFLASKMLTNADLEKNDVEQMLLDLRRDPEAIIKWARENLSWGIIASHAFQTERNLEVDLNKEFPTCKASWKK